MKTINIAIDGPSGAGKSSIAKEVSAQLGLLYIDTGAMYRAIGLGVYRRGIDAKDAEGVCAVLDELEVTLKHTENGQRVFLNGEDVSEEIRLPEISAAASDVAVIPAVRLKLVELQREIARNADVIMDGRDIGTYVLPDAQLKIFLTATPEERARRRVLQLEKKGIVRKYEDVLEGMQYRDQNDSGRDFAPLRQAEDAILVDSTELTKEETVEKISALAKAIRKEQA